MEKVHFTGEKATMLGTLFGRALDARRADPILGDTAADEAVRRIDYDFRKLGVNENTAVSVAIRARAMDEIAGKWLSEHPDAVVLHLGCGMDTRVFRLDPPPTVAWFDVDYPEVVDLRTRLYPERDGYTTIGSSVTDFEWLDQVPGDRPALIVAEGLTMYLTAESGGELVRRLVGKFPSGRLVCDFFSSLGIKAQMVNPVVRRSGATLRWGIDDPHDLERYGLSLVSCLDASEWAAGDTLTKLPTASRLALRATALIPAVRRMGRIGEWEF
ncbi:class I SAM-dependent methyltransferase [Amycolatopsis jejuensis]|uniref:class I SAM-dependent methyltransferase n=1 Tax=Amycolatopsis jejuensis TaxID=330084 RepID=UPI000526BAB9|nr:class I SAM-dependent methyltransferase [Amycolatopsis jejuensis]